MIGTAINAVGILAGGIAGALKKKPLSIAQESFWKVALGVFTVYYGLHLAWINLNGSPLQILKQLLIVIIALSLGRGTGWLLRLQKISNQIGQQARDRINAATEKAAVSSSEGFKICAPLFCAAPLGILGAVQEGLSGYFYPLIVKGIMDGLATMGLARLLGKSVALAALPVFVFQGTITLVCSEWIGPFLRSKGLEAAVSATCGLLIFSVALVILQLKKIPLADYLPSLFYAALISWLWR
jgi:uncharacterized membrane protein YqgA involved in biofilm formation